MPKTIINAIGQISVVHLFSFSSHVPKRKLQSSSELQGSLIALSPVSRFCLWSEDPEMMKIKPLEQINYYKYSLILIMEMIYQVNQK